MKKRKILIIFLGVLCLLLVIALFSRKPKQTSRDQAEQIMERVDNAVNEVMGDEWSKQSQSEIIPFTFEDYQGEKIIYYVCKTTFYTEDAPEITGLDPILNQVINPDTAENSHASKVCELDAMLYEKKGRTFLCWTVSPECSLAIEYNPNAVSEADIIRMAESVPASSGLGEETES